MSGKEILEIGELFQADLENAVSQKKNCVTPIISRSPQGNLSVLGSATFLKLGVGRFLCTAKHVIEASCNDTICLIKEERLVEIEKNKLLLSDELDLAIGYIHGDFIPNEISFLDEADFLSEIKFPKGLAAIIGYPTSKGNYNKQKKLLNITATLVSGKIDAVFLNEVQFFFNKNRFNVRGQKVKIIAPDPYGMSGGAILVLEALQILSSDPQVKIIGIATDWVRDDLIIKGLPIWSIVKFIENNFDL
ncbi:MAG TPA: hypothetical protein VLZ84_04180 [Asticcacaulis sp.]|nr:hypothetical protein [Asticcacaulis sp.]